MTAKELAQKNYARGLWTIDMIGNLVSKGKITPTDYEEITGIKYTGNAPAGSVTEEELNNAYVEGVNSL